MASLGRLAVTPRVERDVDGVTVTLLDEHGVWARRYPTCRPTPGLAPDLPPAESRPAGGGA